MNIGFKNTKWLSYLSLGQTVVCLVLTVFASLYDQYQGSVIFLLTVSIISSIALLVVEFGNLKDDTAKKTINLIAFIASFICLLVANGLVYYRTMLDSGFVTGYLFDAYATLGANESQTVIGIITGIIRIFAHIFSLILIVSLAIYVFSSKEKKDVYKIVSIANWGYVISSLLIMALGIIESFFADHLYFYSVCGLVCIAASGLIVFFMTKGAYYVEKPKSEKAINQPVENKSSVAFNYQVDERQKAELLVKYKELLDKGVITQEEFDKKKAEILK